MRPALLKRGVRLNPTVFRQEVGALPRSLIRFFFVALLLLGAFAFQSKHQSVCCTPWLEIV
jgi:hypothetical protein